jgi:hypothetical protein
MNNRKELIEEQVLRDNIRKAIKLVRENKSETEAKEEKVLRSVIRKMLSEGTAVGDDAPHDKTGINFLRTTLKKIIPSIKDAYMSLTTDEAQRESYIAHLINGVDNLLAPIEVNAAAPELSGNNAALAESDLDEEVEVSIGDGENEFIDIGDIGLEDEEEPEVEEEPEDEDLTTMTTGLDGDEHDETGRNAALATFKQIQGNIIDDFEQLAADEDREIYHDYLKTNILLWRDKFEDALSPKLPEPSTPEYESEAEEGTTGEEGATGEEEFDLEDL